MKKKGKRIGIVLSIVMILIMMMSVTSNAAMQYTIVELDYARSNDSITISRESILSGEVTQAKLSIIYNTIQKLKTEANKTNLSEYLAINTTPPMIEISDELRLYCMPTVPVDQEIYINGGAISGVRPILFQQNNVITSTSNKIEFAIYKDENGIYYALVDDETKKMLTNITEVDEASANYDFTATFYFEEKSLVTEATSGMGTILGWVAKPFNALISGEWNTLLVLFAVGIAISGVLIAVKIIRKFIWGD